MKNGQKLCVISRNSKFTEIYLIDTIFYHWMRVDSGKSFSIENNSTRDWNVESVREIFLFFVVSDLNLNLCGWSQKRQHGEKKRKVSMMWIEKNRVCFHVCCRGIFSLNFSSFLFILFQTPLNRRRIQFMKLCQIWQRDKTHSKRD